MGNGGVPVEMTLTYSKAIDARADNAVILEVCGSMAEYLQVPYNRVQDEFGGSFNNPSPMLAGGAKEGSAAAPAEGSASAVEGSGSASGDARRLQEESASVEASTSAEASASNSTENATVVQTEWAVSLFV